MIRIKADNELLDIETHDVFTAFRMARIVRPSAVAVSDTTGGPHALADADPAFYTGDLVAHWGRPGETGEIVETIVPRSGPRAHWVSWDDGFEPVAYLPASLIRVTKLES